MDGSIHSGSNYFQIVVGLWLIEKRQELMRCGNNQDEIKWIMRIHNETMQNHEKLGIKGSIWHPWKLTPFPQLECQERIMFKMVQALSDTTKGLAIQNKIIVGSKSRVGLHYHHFGNFGSSLLLVPLIWVCESKTLFKVTVSAADSAGTETDWSRRLGSVSGDAHKAA